MEDNKNIETNEIEETDMQALIIRNKDERVNIRTSNKLTNLLPALINFHKKLDSIEKSSANPFFKSSYSTIDNILEHIKPILADNGLCLYQAIIDGDEGHVSIKTILFHESGEFIETDSVPFPVDKRNIQATMSSISYIRRYTINSICNLAFKDDDKDANDVPGTKPYESQNNAQSNPSAPPTSSRRRR